MCAKLRRRKRNAKEYMKISERRETSKYLIVDEII
jgi:hypothetical protein